MTVFLCKIQRSPSSWGTSGLFSCSCSFVASAVRASVQLGLSAAPCWETASLSQTAQRLSLRRARTSVKAEPCAFGPLCAPDRLGDASSLGPEAHSWAPAHVLQHPVPHIGVWDWRHSFSYHTFKNRRV